MKNKKGKPSKHNNKHIPPRYPFFFKIPWNQIDIEIYINTKTIIKKEKIKRALKRANARNKAIIIFIATSELRSKDITNLKIKDFLKTVNISTIDELLNMKNKHEKRFNRFFRI